MRFSRRELFHAWLAATVFRGAPSTLHALARGGDPLEATLAAGAVLVPPDSALPVLFAAAGVVHLTVSSLWTLVFGLMLLRRHL